MKVSTVPRYLFGSREAIMEIATSRWSLLVGALFVITGGLAREYDGENLLFEPWHVFRPMVASLVTGTTLFLMAQAASLIRLDEGEGEPPRGLDSYRAFLSLFWMTAPMAWLYAVPYERMLGPVEAVSVNLWTLGFVALWRVALMIRVIHVVYGFGYIGTFFLVMLFGDLLVYIAMWVAPVPIIDFMGGLRHTDRDALVASTAWSLTIYSILTAPVWILGTIASLFVLKPRWADVSVRDTDVFPRGAVICGLVSILAFAPLLLLAQPEQVRRWRAEKMLKSERIAEAFAYMSAHAETDFPPHWDAPPRQGYGEDVPNLDRVREEILKQDPAPWVTRIYLPKIERALAEDLLVYGRMPWGDAPEGLGTFWSPAPTREQGLAAAFLLEHAEFSDAEVRAMELIRDMGLLENVASLPSPHQVKLIVNAASRGDTESLRRLLDAGIDPDAQAEQKHDPSTAIAAAVEGKHLETVALLLDAGADPDLGAQRDWGSPAHFAAHQGTIEILRLLLESGANPHVSTEASGTLLFAAVAEQHTETVEYLLDPELGIDLQAPRGSDGATALHIAYARDNMRLVQMLLDAGADPMATDNEGRTPEEY